MDNGPEDSPRWCGEADWQRHKKLLTKSQRVRVSNKMRVYSPGVLRQWGPITVVPSRR